MRWHVSAHTKAMLQKKKKLDFWNLKSTKSRHFFCVSAKKSALKSEEVDFILAGTAIAHAYIYLYIYIWNGKYTVIS